MLNVSTEPLFGIEDYVVFGLVALSSLAIGVYYACANKTTDEYFLGSRKLSIFPVGVSLLASYLSAITIIGKPAEIYYFGVEFWFFSIGHTVGAFITSVTFVPLLHPLKITSVNEYIYMRYEKKSIVYLCCFIQVVMALLVNGVVLFGPATMLENFAGVPVWASMLAASQIALIYTTIGGFKAVIWSDVLQAAGILIGLLTVVIMGCTQVGSLVDVFEVFQSQGRGNIRTDVSLTVRSTVWSYVFGLGLRDMAVFGVMQPSVQRFCSMPNLQAARRIFLVSIPGNFIMSALACLSGVVAFAYYTKLGCDPYKAGILSNTNQIIPQFIKDVLNFKAIPGLFAACIFCGTVSNLSSSYNSCAALIWNDVLRDALQKYHLRENRKSLITKLITVLAGLLSTASGFLLAEIGGTLMQMIISITGVLMTPLSAYLVLGALTPKTSWKSASLSALLSSAFVLSISTGGVLYGTNKVALPTVTHNCSRLLDPLTATDYGNLTQRQDDFHYKKEASLKAESLGYLDYSLSADLTTQPASPTTPGMKDVHFLFRISHLWYFPLGFIAANVVGLFLTVIPGISETEPVEHRLIFPFVRRWTRRKEYQLYEKSANGNVFEPATENVKRILV